MRAHTSHDARRTRDAARDKRAHAADATIGFSRDAQPRRTTTSIVVDNVARARRLPVARVRVACGIRDK